ncbi:protein kinase-like domain, Coatomer beta' subunit (COPB2), WD40 repeat, conserved site [Artemisia annua]|uniref:Protein kinase-like domain, Coatomer beta' subunit (COPB2), WD40 repeat, conserved site n=1 Tax=Artemisia annua TaxID=35608 RepID=A0A2U1MT03_ARTAN|nr:protein kinase-like domain, Coatomer beta' subunit (COPB2), WD40 repeat, conserved site [Artemisia annua]
MGASKVEQKEEKKNRFPMKRILQMETGWYTSLEEAAGAPSSCASDVYLLETSTPFVEDEDLGCLSSSSHHLYFVSVFTLFKLFLLDSEVFSFDDDLLNNVIQGLLSNFAQGLLSLTLGSPDLLCQVITWIWRISQIKNLFRSPEHLSQGLLIILCQGLLNHLLVTLGHVPSYDYPADLASEGELNCLVKGLFYPAHNHVLCASSWAVTRTHFDTLITWLAFHRGYLQTGTDITSRYPSLMFLWSRARVFTCKLADQCVVNLHDSRFQTPQVLYVSESLSVASKMMPPPKALHIELEVINAIYKGITYVYCIVKVG